MAESKAGTHNPVDLTVLSDQEVLLTRVVDAPRDLVWEAWTNPEHLPHWMLGPEGWTMPVCEIDLRPGGTHRMVWRRADGTEMEIKGGYRDVAAPERLVSTESWGPGWPETVNTITFAEEEGRTTVSIVIHYPSKEARDAALETPMKEGMQQGYDRLDVYIKTMAGETA